ncbi:MAG: DNA alkylation repair protein [Deltaproteobacteria bacterium]|nr:DNA alkylation repair protein [Deltaproteobacteria bacterium]
MTARHLDDVMAALRGAGKPGTAAIYRRHGVEGEALGVAYAELDKLARRIGADPVLATALWESGVHEARVLATRAADPDGMERGALEAWLAATSDYPTNDAVSALAARRADAAALAEAWIVRDDVWGRCAGWNVVAALALAGRLPEGRARAWLERIRRDIGRAPNRVRHAMNNALIAIGGALADARDQALAVAAAIGKVEVDHGETGCKTPDAASYIRKMAARAAAKSPAKVAKARARRVD